MNNLADEEYQKIVFKQMIFGNTPLSAILNESDEDDDDDKEADKKSDGRISKRRLVYFGAVLLAQRQVNKALIEFICDHHEIVENKKNHNSNQLTITKIVNDYIERRALLNENDPDDNEPNVIPQRLTGKKRRRFQDYDPSKIDWNHCGDPEIITMPKRNEFPKHGKILQRMIEKENLFSSKVFGDADAAFLESTKVSLANLPCRISPTSNRVLSVNQTVMNHSTQSLNAMTSISKYVKWNKYQSVIKELSTESPWDEMAATKDALFNEFKKRAALLPSANALEISRMTQLEFSKRFRKQKKQ